MQGYTKMEKQLLDYLGEEIFDISVGLDPQTDLLAAGLDSLALLKLLQFIEDSMLIRIPEGELIEEHIRTVNNLVQLIGRLEGSQPA
jgi:acyl carrier protein